MTDAGDVAYVAHLTELRAARDERLRRSDGWLALVGLQWLVPGENRVGEHPANEVILRGQGIPPRVGSVWVEDGRVRFVPHPGVDLPATALEDDLEGAPTVLELGTLRFHVIRRGERLGLRVRDAEAPALKRFAGLKHFPTDPSWRVTARLEPADSDATLEIADITGTVSRDVTPGTIAFDREGSTWHIAALPGEGEDGSLWLIFGDATNGTDTYGGGRYLVTEPLAADGSLAVDFNLAYNPPCVFSPYATCPLPPAQNRLSLRIEAGELTYHAEEAPAQ
jgi:uncharacterized protein (DUF1684 family)